MSTYKTNLRQLDFKIARSLGNLGLPIPIASSYMSLMGGKGRGYSSRVSANTAVHWSPNKPWRSISIFNLWMRGTGQVFFVGGGGGGKLMYIALYTAETSSILTQNSPPSFMADTCTEPDTDTF